MTAGRECCGRLEGGARVTTGGSGCDALLLKASRVCVVECDETGQERTVSHLEDVSRYLERHGVKVVSRAPVHAAKSVADELVRVAKDEGADLIIAGAYGHSRLGEQIFGGVTRDLLSMSPICCLLSH